MRTQARKLKPFFCLFQVDGDALARCTSGLGLLRPGWLSRGMGAG
jgi:hypothetical protein